tara:strand:- start:474 stop:1301 length:828 start_codon:yes stop_codon:yes gene_type:complete
MSTPADSKSQTLTQVGENAIEASNLCVGYGPISALENVNLKIPHGSFVSVLGANGAGKTTLVRSVTGILWIQHGKIRSGDITIDGVSILGKKSASIVKAGVAQVPEGRMLFPYLTVEENLLCGAATRKDRSEIAETLVEIWDLFPQIAKLKSQTAGLLSGGEQQMVAVGRALMSRPRILVCDELSLGLAPQIVQQLFELLHKINTEEKVTILAIEQNARLALQYSQYAYVFEIGKVVLEGNSQEMRENPEVQELYLGGAGDAREAYETIRNEYGR